MNGRRLFHLSKQLYQKTDSSPQLSLFNEAPKNNINKVHRFKKPQCKKR